MLQSPIRIPLIKGNKNYQDVTEDILRPMANRPGKFWYLGIFLSGSALLFGAFMIFWTIWKGIGTWGLNRTVGWGWGITNFVWWIGIGHAGTFISAILLLFRQKWRTSINRSAEAMTIFAVICAALFPVIHMGRPLLGFFIFPYPNFRGLWVNFNSPLVWDVFAISTYFTVSLVFWYVGLIPDIGTVRDKLKAGFKKVVYNVLSFGWTGSARHWHRHEVVSLILAALATPLVLSVHSIVSMDFATSVIPGWHTTIFPPYFVAGAIFSGFAMVLTLMIITRKALHLEDYITVSHVESMNKVIIATGSIVGLAYITELFISWYSGVEYEHFALINRATGPYWWAYWIMMTANVISPQLLWIKKLRTNLVFTFFLSLVINIGMWFERFVIVVTSLHRDYLTSSWTMYKPTIVEVGLFLGTLGFFFTAFFLFIRIFPVIAIAEVKTVIKDTVKKPFMKTRIMEDTTYVSVIFDNEKPMLEAVQKIQESNEKILDVQTPFPVHGLDEALKMKRTRIPIAGFICGALGGLLGFLFQAWVFTIDYPLVFGGKPLLAVPSFIPITFELTVLFTALGVVAALLIRSRLKPVKKFKPVDARSTDDRFVVLVDAATKVKSTRDHLKAVLSEIQAVEIV